MLKVAITIVEFIIGVLALLLVGDYLGYKLGRTKLLSACGVVALAVIIGFTIFSAVVLIRG